MKRIFKEFYYSTSYYFKTTDKFLFFTSIGASLISFILIFSLYPNAISSLRPFQIKVISTIIGIILAIFISNIDYHKIEKFIKPFSISVIVLNLLPFTPLGKTRADEMLTNAGAGSANLNWINLGFTKIQPSEFLKVAFILTFSYHCSKVLREINKPKTLLKLILHALIPIGIIFIQKDYGTMTVFLFITFCIIITAIVLNLLPFTPLGKTRADEMLTNAGAGSVNLNWINLGFTKIQPSEFLKIAFILTFSYHCSKVLREINNPKTLLKLVLHALVPIGIIFIQKDYGTMTVFLFITFCIVITANTNWKVILAIAAMGGICLLLFVTGHLPSYLLKRVYVLFNLEQERLGLGLQQYTGMITLATGGLFGKGFNSNELIYSTPELHNDMVFSHIGQTLGFIGCVTVLIWVVIYCVRILQLGKNSKDNLGCLICVGIFAMFFFQSAINIGMALCISPVIGISLPFLSAGGTFVFSTYIALGVLLSIHKHSYKLTLF